MGNLIEGYELKCTSCGANLIYTPSGTAKCDSCGATYVLPEKDDNSTRYSALLDLALEEPDSEKADALCLEALKIDANKTGAWLARSKVNPQNRYEFYLKSIDLAATKDELILPIRLFVLYFSTDDPIRSKYAAQAIDLLCKKMKALHYELRKDEASSIVQALQYFRTVIINYDLFLDFPADFARSFNNFASYMNTISNKPQIKHITPYNRFWERNGKMLIKFFFIVFAIIFAFYKCFYSYTKTQSIAPDEITSIKEFVIRWKTAWEAIPQNGITEYSNYYDKSFYSKYKTMDYSEWMSDKKKLKKKNEIEVAIENVKIKKKTDGTIIVSFDQAYSDGKIKDKGKKELKLRKINSDWKIIGEEWKKINH